jgi:hypothetical protein
VLVDERARQPVVLAEELRGLQIAESFDERGRIGEIAEH